METKKVKQFVKEHKKQFIIGGVATTLFVGGFFVGKKIGKGQSSLFSRQIGDVARDIKVTQPIPLPEGVTKIYKEIDEDIFVDIASEMENALINLDIETLDLIRSWEVADGITKTLDVSIKTIKE